MQLRGKKNESWHFLSYEKFQGEYSWHAFILKIDIDGMGYGWLFGKCQKKSRITHMIYIVVPGSIQSWKSILESHLRNTLFEKYFQRKRRDKSGTSLICT